MTDQKPKSFMEMVKEDTLSPIEPSELFDICVNKGILQEVNRTFFNPLGLVLQLNEAGSLTLMKSTREAGPAIEMIDKMQLNAFRNWSSMKMTTRQKFYGFVIQTQDLLRADQMKQGNVSAKTQRLSLILNLFDQVAYECKQKIMRSSATKDGDLSPVDYSDLLLKVHYHFKHSNWVDVINYLAMMIRDKEINDGLAKIVLTETINE